jgi:hypothetical protein
VGERTYERRRIQIAFVDAQRVVIATGLATGDAVVAAGAAELFGTEFGAAK